MIKLNLVTSCEEHEILKEYLENNVSETLADKINNGVQIVKDGITLLSKKDLVGFMDYAQSEARKTAEKGKNYKAVHHDTVFGWLIHYFEEDSIEGRLFNEDGSEYKPVTKTVPKSDVKQPKKPDKQPQSQFSLFDLIEVKTDDKGGIMDDKHDTDDVDMPDEEEMREIMTELHKEEEKPKGNPVYQKYIETQNKYPKYAVLYRLGDFYEVFGENAKRIANEIEITLTGRDCGLPERVPMIGFPVHALDVYINKIRKFISIVVVENGKESVLEKYENSKKIDYDTGEIYDDLSEEEMREFDGDIEEPKDVADDDDYDKSIEMLKKFDREVMLKLYDILGDVMNLA